jgi:DNA-binding beta-propeller fold protein YncE
LKLITEPSGSRHRLASLTGALALFSLALLGIAARAHASEEIYWDNFGANNVAFANIDGTGGGALNVAGTEIDAPEGMAYDAANGRIYIASSGNNKIDWVSIDGSGGGVLDTGAAPINVPEGIAVDPATQTVYWANNGEPGSIGYASANGGGGGALNTEGASQGFPYKLALDTASGRVYWIGEVLGEVRISYANLDGTGGGDLSVPEAEVPDSWTAIDVDPVAERMYILERDEETVYWVNLSGVGAGEEVDTENSSFEGPFGMAFDPSLGRFYWANEANETTAEGAFGTATLTPGGGGGINIASAPVESPQDPVILKSPLGTGAPQVSAASTALSCSQGSWADYPGSYVYAAPTSYAYQWSKDGQPISGATEPTYAATASGSYSCTVTGTNQLGSASQTSAGYTVTIAPPVAPSPASFSLAPASKKKVKVAAGKAATLSLSLKNVGGTTSSSSKVCVKLSKKAKKGLVAPKCVAVAALAPGASSKVTLKVKTKGGAKGTYKFSVVASGTSGSSTLPEQISVQAKKKHHKKHGKK